MTARRLTSNIRDRVRQPTPRGLPRPRLSSVAPGSPVIRRHPDLAFYGIGLALLVAMLPLLRDPLLSVVLVAVLIGGLIAWRSPVVPLALCGVPPLVDAIAGSDPLPSGGFTFLFSAWITAAVVFALVRGRQPLAPRSVVFSVAALASFALLGLMLIWLGISPDQAYGRTKVQLYTADVLIIMVGAIFVGTRPDYVRLFVIILLVVDGTGAVLFLYTLVAGSAQTVVGGRFSLAAAEYPIDMGRASADGLLLAVYTVLASSRRRTRLAAMAIAPVLAVALAAAGSRGPVVAFAFGLLALLGLTATNPRARSRLVLVGAAFMVAIIVVPLVVPSSALARALSTIIGSASGLSSNGRSQAWALAIAAFSHHIWLGTGTGGTAVLVPGLLYPHNLLLEVATELGLVGFLAIVLVLGGFLRALGRCWRLTMGPDRLISGLLIAMFLTEFVNANFSDPIQGNGSVWLWGGLAVGMSARLTAERSSRPVAQNR